jgi:tripartite ATP-independent transporter DctM subunit
MEWWLILVVVFVSLFGSFLTGMPIAFSFMAINIVGLVIVAGGTKGLSLLTGSIFESVSGFELIAIPMFFLLGEVLFHSGVVAMVMDAVDRWIGHLRARLLLVSLGAGTALATLSGAGIADTALIGSTLYPEMERRKYDRKLSLGTITSSGLLAALIPPSALAVLLASIAEKSAGRILLGGAVPGFMIAGLYTAFVLIRVRINPDLAPAYNSGSVRFAEKMWATIKLAPLLLIIFAVMGFILLGIATPSEAAATGALSAIVVTALYGRLTPSVLTKSLDAVVRITAMILFIIAGAKAFSQLLALSGASQQFFNSITGLDVDPFVVLMAIQATVLILGLFMDPVAIMLVAIPIVDPVVVGFGWDTTWFYVLFLINMTIGLESPPFGLALFVLKGVVPHVPLSDIFKAQIPFIAIDVFAMLLIMNYPIIVTWLPDKVL